MTSETAEGSEDEQATRDLSRRSEERYAQLLDTAPDAIVVVEGTGRIALINAQTERLFGYTRSELVGQGLDVLIPERFRKTHGGHVQRFFTAPGARPMGSVSSSSDDEKTGPSFRSK
jgi:PAS domain S-box-containing protein